jgi:predicted TPR repeat methyltransferase
MHSSGAEQGAAVAEDETTTLELSMVEALALAVRLHQGGHLNDAQMLYEHVLQADPGQPDALHFLGILQHRRGSSEAAVELIRRSIAVGGEDANRYNNLGNVLLEAGRLAEATEAYQRAIALAGSHADAYSNLGAVLKAQKRFDEAAAAYAKAIELEPRHADAHNNMGNLLSAQGRTREALAYYCEAIALMPAHPEARKMLGIAYYTLGRLDDAAKVYREWLAEEPGHPVALHMLAGCTGENVPARAADDYIELTFDRFADSFDAKLERLAYRAPQLVADAVARHLPASSAPGDLLDAGCGTGLCGPLLRARARRLTGVDLSAQMLSKAEQRGIYDELVKAELTAYFQERARAFDLIVSADTLVYFGALEAVAAAAAAALRPQGLMVFTVETVDDAQVAPQGYRINPHGRYSHGRGYLERTLSAAGLTVLEMDAAPLRMEGGAPVDGLVVICRRGAGQAPSGPHTESLPS